MSVTSDTCESIRLPISLFEKHHGLYGYYAVGFLDDSWG